MGRFSLDRRGIFSNPNPLAPPARAPKMNRAREMKLRTMHHKLRGLGRNPCLAEAAPRETSKLMDAAAKEIRKVLRKEGFEQP